MSGRLDGRVRGLLLALALTGGVARAGKVDDIRARGRLVVSVKNDANRTHKDPAHFQKRGFEVELAHRLAGRIVGDPAQLELKMLARPARLPFLAAGAVDLVVSMIPVSADNSSQCDLSHPYFSSGLSLLLPATARPLTLAELAGKTVAFRKQSYNDHGAELQRIAGAQGIRVNVRYYATFDEAVRAVTAGQAIAVGGNVVDLDAYRAAHAGFAVNQDLLQEQRVAVAVRKGDRDLLDLVNRTIDELRRTGELERMTEKWKLPYLLPPL